ncbi:MAG TPA: DUF1036 domain-containing protein [Rhizomicrobium sp.]|jgi:uncharacterized membrane protein|nr:DUF1036 domain-containing protein [Rhizomicrobium sp.]
MLTMRFCFALILFALMGQPAFAGLNVCNKTQRDARVAVGRFDGTEWMSQGWWTIAPRACAAVVSVPLKARYYYLYAVDGGSGSWDGARKFCVGNTDTWQSLSRSDCAGRGMDRKGFFRIDTGDQPNYTQNLSD